jgi:hypothetical protein
VRSSLTVAAGGIITASLLAACSYGAAAPGLERGTSPSAIRVAAQAAPGNPKPPIDRVTLHAARPQRGAASWPPNGSYVYLSLTSPTSGQDEIVVLKQGDIKGAPVATITSRLNGALGLWVDQGRNLWVANAGGFILEFPPGKATPKKTISVPKTNGYPVDVWVAEDGTIYAITYLSSSSVISKRTPDGTWSTVGDPDMTFETGIVGDSSGDLFATGFLPVQNGGTVEWLPSGTTQWQSIGFPYIPEPGGIAFDFLGRLTIANGEVGNVFSYDWLSLQLQDAFRCYDCSAIGFNANGKRLWATTDASPATLEQFQFPGGRPLNKVTFQQNVNANGMALSPAFAPPTERYHK